MMVHCGKMKETTDLRANAVHRAKNRVLSAQWVERAAAATVAKETEVWTVAKARLDKVLDALDELEAAEAAEEKTCSDCKHYMYVSPTGGRCCSFAQTSDRCLTGELWEPAKTCGNCARNNDGCGDDPCLTMSRWLPISTEDD